MSNAGGWTSRSRRWDSPSADIVDLPPLTDGRIIRRYKRFLADVELADGTRITAHCPNTGSMRTCWTEGAPVQLSHSDSPRRKLPWTLERVDMGSGWVGVNTHRVNAVIAEGAAQGRLPGLESLRNVIREVTIDAGDSSARSRIDLLLSGAGAEALVEIKNVTLLDGRLVRFPDAVSARALKHVRLLQKLVSPNRRAVVLFAVNRPEGEGFAPADDVDPQYATALKAAAANGVEIVAVRLAHGPQCIDVGRPVPVLL